VVSNDVEKYKEELSSRCSHTTTAFTPSRRKVKELEEEEKRGSKAH
jgi:hypothetical protein